MRTKGKVIDEAFERTNAEMLYTTSYLRATNKWMEVYNEDLMGGRMNLAQDRIMGKYDNILTEAKMDKNKLINQWDFIESKVDKQKDYPRWTYLGALKYSHNGLKTLRW